MNNMENIQEKILEIINDTIENGVSKNQVDDDLSQLGMDSLKFISIVVTLEENFDIEVPDEYLLMTEMNTVRKMVIEFFHAGFFKGDILYYCHTCMHI